MRRPADGHRGQEVVGVVVAEEGGDGVVLLAAQAVPAAPGDHVHGVADVEQVGVRGVDPAVGAVGEPRLGEGEQHGHVAEAAVGLLELRLDGLGEVALALVAPGERLDELRGAACGRCRASRAPRWTGPPRRARSSPASGARSSSPTAAMRSPAATWRHWVTVRTLWSRRTPASQMGYQMRSASAVSSFAGSERSEWRRTRS